MLDWLKKSFENLFGGRRKRSRRRKKTAKRKSAKKIRRRSLKPGGKPSKKIRPKIKSSVVSRASVRITPPPQTKRILRAASPKSYSPSPAMRRAALRPLRTNLPRPAGSQREVPVKPKAPAGVKIGTITHYFNKIQVGVLTVEKPLKVGDLIEIRRQGERIGKEPVRSLQINHIPIDEARKGEEIGMKFTSPVHAGDEVFKQ
jgi:hypothetical protein